MIHGYSNNGEVNCATTWDGAAKSAYRAAGFSSAQLITLKYYSADDYCNKDTGIDASEYTSIGMVGSKLAWWIYKTYSRWGISVDIVAHSMGGLVTRAAITGTQFPTRAPFNGIDAQFGERYTWPPYLYIQDVSTISTPYEGAQWATVLSCSLDEDFDNQQCYDMDGTGAFIQQWIRPYGNPQAKQVSGRGGTDWTLIGSWQDGTVGFDSGMELHSTFIPGHKVFYVDGPTVLDHTPILSAPAGNNYRKYYCDYYNSCDMSPPEGCSPVCNLYDYNLATWVYDGTANSPVTAAALGSWYEHLE
jgi:hypothetical protein